MKVHDGVVVTLVSIHTWISVQSYDQIISKLGHFLQEVQMANMKAIKGAGDVDDRVGGLGLAGVGELEDLLRRREELGHSGPGGAGVGVRGQLL